MRTYPSLITTTEAEEEDEVAPLPEVVSPVKRRGTRSSAGGEPIPIRRSSRLSVASSSPEPVTVSRSPVKGRRKTTRASGVAKEGSASAGRSTRARKR